MRGERVVANERELVAHGHPGRAEERRPELARLCTDDEKTVFEQRTKKKSSATGHSVTSITIDTEKKANPTTPHSAQHLPRDVESWGGGRQARVDVALRRRGGREKKGGLGESNPRPRPPEGRIMPLDQIPNLGPFRFEGTGLATQILVLE